MRIGVVGKGRMARGHVKAFKALAEVEVPCCCDILEDKVNAFADQWEIVNFAATCFDTDNVLDPRQVGEPLWEAKYDARRLATIKVTLGTRFWSALYQQTPSPEEGDVVEDFVKLVERSIKKRGLELPKIQVSS